MYKNSVTIHPPRLRFATPTGPFRLGEMCLEDLALERLSFCRLMNIGTGVTTHVPGCFVAIADYAA